MWLYIPSNQSSFAPGSACSVKDSAPHLSILDSTTELSVTWNAKLLQPLEMARRVASEYGTKDSLIDSGNLYAALCQCLDRIDVVESRLADAIHYPACWDTACYTSVDEALREVYADFKCSEECQKGNPTEDADATLRNQFAGQTLQAILSNPGETMGVPPNTPIQIFSDAAAKFAFLIADAMVAESKK